MKKRKSKLSRKLLLAFVGALVCIVMTVTLIGSVLSMVLDEKIMIQTMYVSQLAMVVLIVIAFYYIVDKMIVRRIEKLNEAMAEVAKGDYEITVPVENKDELALLTESFNRMTTELRANAFLSKDFTRYVSHEFKTPLAVIRSYAELSQMGMVPAVTAENMAVIIAETDRLTRLSKDMLELCRLDSTTIVEKKDRFSPAAQIRSILLELQLLWNEKGIKIIPELENFEVVSNEDLLFRVWQNIIGNAIKFTDSGGCVRVSLRKNEGTLTFEVEDNGIGISDADKMQIFTPFHAGNPSHNQEGCGLGLSLSKKIVEKLGGSIVFESQVHIGTTFTVTIPIK